MTVNCASGAPYFAGGSNLLEFHTRHLVQICASRNLRLPLRFVGSLSKKPTIPKGYEVLSQGEGTHDVVIRTAVKEEIVAKANEEQRAGLNDLLTRFVTHGVPGLPRNKFNGQEGWFPSEKSPGKVRLQAFKPWQLRAYGFLRDFGKRPTFFITGVDCSKKADRAKQSIVKAAGKEAYRLSVEIGS